MRPHEMKPRIDRVALWKSGLDYVDGEKDELCWGVHFPGDKDFSGGYVHFAIDCAEVQRCIQIWKLCGSTGLDLLYYEQVDPVPQDQPQYELL